jgi:hypothetical protein
MFEINDTLEILFVVVLAAHRTRIILEDDALEVSPC